MLNYQICGSPNETPLCFLHGFMGSSVDWKPVAEALREQAFCLTVDLPGHGDSTDRSPPVYTMEGVSQALADVFEDAGVDRCSIVGYSMGGRVALYFSVHHPDRVRQLVLESVSPGLRSEEERAQRRAVDDRRATRIEDDLPSFLEEWYRQPLFSSLVQHDLVDGMVARRRQNDPDELARALRGLGPGNQPSLWERLADLHMPTLVLTGALDKKYLRVTKETASRLRDSHRVVVPNAGHNVHAERPQAYLAHLVQFLETT